VHRWRFGHLLAGEECGDLMVVERLGVVVDLTQAAAELTQAVNLLRVLDALGDGLSPNVDASVTTARASASASGVETPSNAVSAAPGHGDVGDPQVLGQLRCERAWIEGCGLQDGGDLIDQLGGRHDPSLTGTSSMVTGGVGPSSKNHKPWR
jgi:hypothetical protein